TSRLLPTLEPASSPSVEVRRPARSRQLLAILFCGLLAAAGAVRAEWLSQSRPMMGTEIRVQVWHEDPAVGTKAVAAVFAEMERIDRLMSTYIDDSRISLINREAAERAVPAGKELYDLLVRSLDMSILTRGAFD